MMRTLHLLLVATMILQPVTATAREFDLGDRIRDIWKEAEHFRESLPDGEGDWARESLRRAQTDDVEQRRLRVRIQNLPPGEEISIVARGGDHFVGELREARAEDLLLAVETESGSTRIHRRFRYDELETAELPEWKGWMAPERAYSLKKDQKVELLLMDGTKVKGRLASATRDEWLLGVGGDEREGLSIDEVASVRKLGMSRTVKILIATGAALAIMTVIFVASWDGGGFTGGLL